MEVSGRRNIDNNATTSLPIEANEASQPDLDGRSVTDIDSTTSLPIEANEASHPGLDGRFVTDSGASNSLRIEDETPHQSDPFCEPCQKASEKNYVFSFCVDCDNFLCEKCEKRHTATKFSDRHTILKKDDMPKQKLVREDVNICEKDNEMFKYFCQIHEEFCCTVCVTTDHGKCGAQNISDVALRFDESQDFKEFQDKVSSLIKKAKCLKVSLEDYKCSLNPSYFSNITSSVMNFKTRLSDKLNEMESKIEKTVAQIQSQNNSEVESLLEALDPILKFLVNFDSYISEIKAYKQTELLFIITKQCASLVENNADSIKDIRKQVSNTIDHQYRFSRNVDLSCFINSTSSLGKVVTRKSICGNKNLKFEQRVDVKEPGDITNCWITGCIELDDDIIVIADYNNWKIKLVDLEESKLTSSLKLSTKPWDVCRMSYKELVASANGRLIVISVNRGLRMRVEQEIPISGECSGVGYKQGHFFVSIIDHESFVIEMTHTGEIVRNISIHSPERTTFTTPFYIDVDEDEDTVFVSDCDNNEVYCLGKDSRVIATYMSRRLRKPFGLAADGDDGLFVVGSDSSNIHYITTSCEPIEICLDHEDGINAPQALAFCKNSARLVVSTNALRSRSATDFLMVFRSEI